MNAKIKQTSQYSEELAMFQNNYSFRTQRNPVLTGKCSTHFELQDSLQCDVRTSCCICCFQFKNKTKQILVVTKTVCHLSWLLCIQIFRHLKGRMSFVAYLPFKKFLLSCVRSFIFQVFCLTSTNSIIRDESETDTTYCSDKRQTNMLFIL